jgi:hypothetical protein
LFCAAIEGELVDVCDRGLPSQRTKRAFGAYPRLHSGTVGYEGHVEITGRKAFQAHM